MALLPPNTSFHRYEIDDATLDKLAQDEKMKTEVEAALAKMERAVVKEIEVKAMRVPILEGIKLLITTGDCCLYVNPEGGIRTFRLDQYVVKRDPMGNVIEGVIYERVHPDALPDSIYNEVKATVQNEDELVDLYTRIKRVRNQWVISQQAKEIDIPEGEGTFALDACPYLFLRWSAINGEDYGRGMVEEYLGDFESLEVLTKAVLKFAAAAAKILFLVRPNGTTRPKKLTNSESGDVIEGNPEDVNVLQMQKFADFNVAKAVLDGIETRLSRVFLLVESVQRSGERVTAEEIRTLVQELETSIGGVYAVLGVELQLPLAKLVQASLIKQKKLPPFPKKLIQPMIITGLEALGRTNDFNKIATFQQFAASVPGAESYVKVDEVLRQAATGVGLDQSAFVKTADEVAQEQQQAQMMQMAQSAAPGMAQEFTKGVLQNENNGTQEEAGDGGTETGTTDSY